MNVDNNIFVDDEDISVLIEAMDSVDPVDIIVSYAYHFTEHNMSTLCDTISVEYRKGQYKLISKEGIRVILNRFRDNMSRIIDKHRDGKYM